MMERLDERTVQKLRSEYLELVKKGINIQKKGDIKAYTSNALLAEQVADRLQALARKK